MHGYLCELPVLCGGHLLDQVFPTMLGQKQKRTVGKVAVSSPGT